MLSTAVIGSDRCHAASVVLTVGLLDDEHRVVVCALDGGTPAAEVLDDDTSCLRFVLPAPSGSLALLAEFSLPDGRDPAVVDRVQTLMRSFRWAG